MSKPVHPVHEYFIYNSKRDKSKCKSCVSEMKGRHSENLMRHLKRKHKDAFKDAVAKKMKNATQQLLSKKNSVNHIKQTVTAVQRGRKSTKRWELADERAFVNQSDNDNSNTNSVIYPGFHGYSEDSSQDKDDPISTKSGLTQETPFSENIYSMTSAIPPKRSSHHHIQKQQRLPSSLDYSFNINEFAIFGQHVATQLQYLPIEEAVLLQQNMQELITAARLKCIHTKDTNQSNIQNSTEVENNSSFFKPSQDTAIFSESEMQYNE